MGVGDNGKRLMCVHESQGYTWVVPWVIFVSIPLGFRLVHGSEGI